MMEPGKSTLKLVLCGTFNKANLFTKMHGLGNKNKGWRGLTQKL